VIAAKEIDMTYYVTALTNDRARLIVHELRTSDVAASDMIADHWLELGYIVIRREEG
jgi:hypothetical protein